MKLKFTIIFEELFTISLVTYLILLLAETIKTGVVTELFNVNYLLGVVLVSGVLTTVLGTQTRGEKKNESGHFDLIFAFATALAAGSLVYYKTRDLGNLSLAIAAITVVIVLLLSYLVLTEPQT